MKKFRLAILGCGNIAKFHAEAFLKAGFLITHCASSINSKSLEKFSNKFKIKKKYKNPYDLLKDHMNWDILLLAVPIEKNSLYLNKIIKLNKVCLVEKPVSLKINFLKKICKLDNKYVRVAYNRRFYPTIQKAKAFIDLNKKVTFKMELPEKVNSELKFFLVKANSAHGVDLINYLFGKLKIIKILKYSSNTGRKVIFKSKNNSIIDLNLNWNSPSNFLIQIEANNEKLEIKPFERLTRYHGMRILNPTKKFPLRRYIPKEVENFDAFNKKFIKLKPGFYEQALEIKSILKGKKPKISASLKDAYETQAIISKIL